MIIKFLSNLVIGTLGTYLLLIAAYDSVFSLQNTVDAAFLVGMILTSVGLITTTNATQVFDGISFVFKQTFSRKQHTHLAFYDYKRERAAKRTSTGGLATLIVGLLFVIATTIISYTKLM